MSLRGARAGIVIAIVLAGATAASAETFFADCERGDDQADGLSPESAWRSLQRVNQVELMPGDSILLRRGTTCQGMLQPRGSGSPGRPITLGSYEVGPRPVIDAGDHEAAVRLFNQEYWHLREIETTGGNPFGIHVSGDVAGVLDHFRIVDVRVRGVRGVVSNKESGLVVVSPGSADTTFNDVIIDGVTAHDSTQWAGILVGGDDFGGTPESPRSTDVIIRNSTVYDVYGDGIVLYQVNGGLIETSVVFDTGKTPNRNVGTPNGIWTWMCGACTVQFNEGYLTNSPGRDGGVYDIDYGCTDNVVQYNYAHDAAAYCVAVFGGFGFKTSNSVVRYNICADNGRDPSKAFQGDIYVFTWGGGVIDGLQIHNNTVYWNPSADGYAINAAGATFSGNRPVAFENNIVYSTRPQLVTVPGATTIGLNHNIYWYSGTGDPRWNDGGNDVTSLMGWKDLGHDALSAYANPLLMNPTRSGEVLARRSFAPRAGSPAIDAGVDLGTMGPRDFAGAAVPFGAAHDIGALEWHPEERCRNGFDDDGDDLPDCQDPDCAEPSDDGEGACFRSKPRPRIRPRDRNWR